MNSSTAMQSKFISNTVIKKLATIISEAAILQQLLYDVCRQVYYILNGVSFLKSLMYKTILTPKIPMRKWTQHLAVHIWQLKLPIFDRQGFFQLTKQGSLLPDITSHQWWIPETALPLLVTRKSSKASRILVKIREWWVHFSEIQVTSQLFVYTHTVWIDSG